MQQVFGKCKQAGRDDHGQTVLPQVLRSHTVCCTAVRMSVIMTAILFVVAIATGTAHFQRMKRGRLQEQDKQRKQGLMMMLETQKEAAVAAALAGMLPMPACMRTSEMISMHVAMHHCLSANIAAYCVHQVRHDP